LNQLTDFRVTTDEQHAATYHSLTPKVRVTLAQGPEILYSNKSFRNMQLLL